MPRLAPPLPTSCPWRSWEQRYHTTHPQCDRTRSLARDLAGRQWSPGRRDRRHRGLFRGLAADADPSRQRGGDRGSPPRQSGGNGAAQCGRPGSFADRPGRTGAGWGTVDLSAGGRVDERAVGTAGERANGVGMPYADWASPSTATAMRDAGRPGGPGGLPKRGLASELERTHAAHPTAIVTCWGEDEHRLGLLPVLRRIWSPVGERPTTAVQRRYEWRSVNGFVRPQTGASWWCLLPAVNAEAFSMVLAEFAHDEPDRCRSPGGLVLDNAGWHHAKALVIPDGIDLVFLPPYRPALQPAERLWPLVNEPIANRAFADLDALAWPLVDRCQLLRRQPAMIHARYPRPLVAG